MFTNIKKVRIFVPNKTNNAMNLIELIRKIGVESKGDISTNSNGIRYYYTTWTVSEPTTQMKKQWYALAKTYSDRKVGGHNVISRHFFIGDTQNSSYFNYSAGVGGKDGEMGFKQLTILG